MGRSLSSACGRPWMVARGRGSLMGTTRCPTYTSIFDRDAFADAGVRRDPAALTDDRPFSGFGFLRTFRSWSNKGHEILVKDQNALTEDDVTSDRLDAERILVVNLQ